jgi:hypothetical protein
MSQETKSSTAGHCEKIAYQNNVFTPYVLLLHSYDWGDQNDGNLKHSMFTLTSLMLTYARITPMSVSLRVGCFSVLNGGRKVAIFEYTT